MELLRRSATKQNTPQLVSSGFYLALVRCQTVDVGFDSW